MHIAVIGTGYVGLVTGACFAEFGVDVTCVDVDEQKIDRLLNGVMPIYEPGLEQLVAKNSQAGRLRFTTDVRQAVEQALVIFLAVGTPPKPDGSPDLSFVENAACSIADYMNGYKVVVTKSTVPIGTGEHIRRLIAERKKTKATFGVVSNPASCDLAHHGLTPSAQNSRSSGLDGSRVNSRNSRTCARPAARYNSAACGCVYHRPSGDRRWCSLCVMVPFSSTSKRCSACQS